MNLDQIDVHKTLVEAIRGYEASRESKLDILSLIEKNRIAHKWKVTYQIYVLRETILWRFVDLSRQALQLSDLKMIAGSRILVRAVLETLSALVYINEKMNLVISNKIKFDEFRETIAKIFIGSHVYPESPRTTKVGTMIKCLEIKYPGIKQQYTHLCETAHPSYIGLTNGYSKTDQKEFVTQFGDYWLEIHGDEDENTLLQCFEILEIEYNITWAKRFDNLESWLTENDKKLESEKSKSMRQNMK